MEYHGRWQMLSPRYLLCFIILLYTQTCFLCPLFNSNSPLSSLSHVSRVPVALQWSCYSLPFTYLLSLKMRGLKEEQFWKKKCEKMKDKNIVNICLLCSTVFVVGVSLNIPVPFYPNEALLKGVSVTQSGN